MNRLILKMIKSIYRLGFIMQLRLLLVGDSLFFLKSTDDNRAGSKVPRNSTSPDPVQERLQHGAVMQAAASF